MTVIASERFTASEAISSKIDEDCSPKIIGDQFGGRAPARNDKYQAWFWLNFTQAIWINPENGHEWSR